MTKATFKSVNDAIAKQGLNAELIKGDGYFYFAGDDVKIDAASVYVCHLYELTLEQWLDHFTLCADRGAAKREQQDSAQLVAICAAPAAPSIDIVARSSVPHVYAYTMQEQSPSGSWVDRMSCDDLDTATRQAAYCIGKGERARVVDNRA